MTGTHPVREAARSLSADSLITRWRRWRVYRRTLADLTALSDRELGRMGLRRSILKRVVWIAAHET